MCHMNDYITLLLGVWVDALRACEDNGFDISCSIRHDWELQGKFFFFNTCMNDEWPIEEKVVMSRIEHEYYLKDSLHDTYQNFLGLVDSFRMQVTNENEIKGWQLHERINQ